MPAPLVLPAPSPPAPTTTQGSTFNVEKATIVWIRSQVQIRCLMRIEITLKMP